MGAIQSYVTLASEFEAPTDNLATEPKKSEQEQLLAEIVALKQEIEQWRVCAYNAAFPRLSPSPIPPDVSQSD